MNIDSSAAQDGNPLAADTAAGFGQGMALVPVRRRRRRSGLPAGVNFAKVLTILEEVARGQGDGILWVDESGRIMISNPAVAKMLERSEGSLRGAHLGKLDPLFDGTSWDQHWDLVNRHGPLNYETCLRGEGERKVEVEMTLSPVVLGGQVMLSVVIRDIGQRRRAERQIISAKRALEEATRLKNEFMVALSHQIRTPLNSVMGATSLLLEEVADPELLGLVRIVMRGERQLLATLGGIGEVVQIEKSLADIRCGPVEVGPLVRQVIEDQRAAAAEHRLDVEVIESAPGLLAWASDALLLSILSRLVDNAVRYTEAGRVTIRIGAVAHGLGPRVEVAVADTGPGMDAEFVARLFQPLVQDTQRRLHYETHGLGLAVSHLLAKVQGGSLRAESTKGVGSTFTLSLPAEAAAN